MTAGWNADVGAESIGTGSDVTLVDGSCFAVSDERGDMRGGVHGLYLFDTRLLSKCCLRIDGHVVEGLSVEPGGPFSATFVGRAKPLEGTAEPTIVVLRSRSVGNGMSESVELRNHAATEVSLEVRLEADVDFASLFDVKGGRAVTARRAVSAPGGRLVFTDGRSDPWSVTLRADPQPAEVAARTFTWRVQLLPGGSWDACVEVTLQPGERVLELAHPCGTPIEQAVHATRLASWRSSSPVLESDDPALDAAVRQAQEDLGALRIFDPDHAERVVVAAGAPWYMTVFGRDSILTAWMALLNGPELALGVLQTLAELQGADVDPATEEEPGRIVHEVRYDQETNRVLGGRSAYYGTADATPLFVMLVGELAHWGASKDQLSSLLPHADRALAWVEHFGDRDGDGYVEYLAATPSGLRNQGWKDSWDAVRYRSGDIASAPLAIAEVQGYTYAAYVARAELADLFGEPELAQRCRQRASTLKQRFNNDFWVDALGWYAMALDADKRPVDALASNVGHCLWTGIVEDDRAAAVAAQLASPALSSGYGLRTLASSMPGYNPLSYHCGSVWPHDTAIAVAGLVRYRQDAAASLLARGLLDASRWYDGRLPELFGGFARDDLSRPVRYPASCSPQAWASAAPLLLARSLIGFEPRLDQGVTRVRWTPFDGVGRLRASGLVVAGARVSVDASAERIVVDGLPDDVRVEPG